MQSSHQGPDSPLQAVVRFLWDAHNCEEAREEEELVVSTPYIEHWNDLIDLWYLGMQVNQYFSSYVINLGGKAGVIV